MAISYTHLEDYVYKLCLELSITKPFHLDMDDIANKLRLQIHYGKSGLRLGNEIKIIPSTPAREWVMFSHELGHFLFHVGNQLLMHPLFKQLQEYQADRFAYHFCVPTFMLEDLEEVTVYKIMNLFNVEYDFALRRLEMYQNKIINRRTRVGTR